MAASFSSNCTAFDGHRLLAAGARLDVALALKRALERRRGGSAAGVRRRYRRRDRLRPQRLGCGYRDAARRTRTRAARTRSAQARRRRARGHLAAAPLGMARRATRRRLRRAAPARRRGAADGWRGDAGAAGGRRRLSLPACHRRRFPRFRGSLARPVRGRSRRLWRSGSRTGRPISSRTRGGC